MKEDMNRYFTRTVDHIHRVQKNMVYLVTNFRDEFQYGIGSDTFILDDETCRELMHNVMKHDQSKFSVKQFILYVELTKYYHQRRVVGNEDYEYPYGMQKLVHEAVEDHYCAENHHPERMKDKAGKMPLTHLVEIVCDLQAMAQEFNEGSCRSYFENVWCKKQEKNFSDEYDWHMSWHFMSKVIGLFEKGAILVGGGM